MVKGGPRRVKRVCGALLVALSLAPLAQASDADDLISALKRARTLAARGQVEVTVLFPPRLTPTRQASALPLVLFRPALIQKNFEVFRLEAEELAGRTVSRYDLVPKVGQAARWSLWVDQVWNLPLAYEERSASGALARRAAFVKVGGGSPTRLIPPDLSAPPRLWASVQAALPGVKPPPGFTPVALGSPPDGRLEITLTDGVNVLALVVAGRNVKAAPGVASRKVGPHFVWLVGNLPQSALKRALEGIRRVDEAGLGTLRQAAASNP